jgi:hypothetical protein
MRISIRDDREPACFHRGRGGEEPAEGWGAEDGCIGTCQALWRCAHSSACPIQCGPRSKRGVRTIGSSRSSSAQPDSFTDFDKLAFLEVPPSRAAPASFCAQSYLPRGSVAPAHRSWPAHPQATAHLPGVFAVLADERTGVLNQTKPEARLIVVASTGRCGCPRRRGDGERSAAWSRDGRRQGKAFPPIETKPSAGEVRGRALVRILAPSNLIPHPLQLLGAP